ncbi:hypothetical protein IPN41_00095 [Candidatus Falkowbacteria bacterium]|nr:MAG: hypothetical protein IPN41_00095 [Candidatus Falkowbacteria bacterium]
MKKIDVAIIIGFILFLLSLLIFGGCTRPANDPCGLAEVESFEIFNKTPNEDTDTLVQNNIKVLGPKAFIKYNRKLTTLDCISASLYKKKHPDDALLITEVQSTGTRTVFVFTNKPPDPAFFQLE